MYRLLIADDEVIEREAIKYIVGQNFTVNMEVYEACNGRELLEKISSIRPDIVLTDIKMPGITGLEAASRIREAYPECRIILMSAFHYFNYAKDGLSLGVDDYITKPVPADVIVSTLNKSIQNIEKSRLKQKSEDEINNKLKNITQYLEEELIVLMSSGEIEEKAVKEYFQILNIQSNAFIAAVVSFSELNNPEDTMGEVQKRIFKKRLVEKLKFKLKSKGIRFFMGASGQHIFVLMLVDENENEYASRVSWSMEFINIKNELCEDLKISLNIGIGNLCESVGNIFGSFLQAKIALKYDPTPGSVTSYGDICSRSSTSEYPYNKEKHLIDSFLHGDEAASLLALDELIDWMSINLNGNESIKQKLYELLLVLIREAVLSLNLLEFNADSESMRRNLFLLDTVREFRTFSKDYVQKKLEELNNIKDSRASTLISTLLNLIKNSYAKDISLESAAEVIKISPFYLSKLFKKETGMNFIDYLSEFRLKKAKELLSVPSNNVKDVCYLVGYKDPNYFARVFKKMSGFTPSEYREKFIKFK